MLTTEQRQAIADRLVAEKERLGSWDAVATRCEVNVATVSHNMQKPGNWARVSAGMWAKVAGAVGYVIGERGWVLTQTTNTRIMGDILAGAQADAQFVAVSHPAGQGKSAGVTLYGQAHRLVYYVACQESWSHKRFCQELARLCGLKVDRLTIADLTDGVVRFFRQQATGGVPLLVIDEANKLKPASLRLIIPLYNELAGTIGLVIVGAHDLEAHIRHGVARDARGYDELESRLGRVYLRLAGVLQADVVAICAANGLTDRAAQGRVWQHLVPRKQPVLGELRTVATGDLRALKQAVQRELREARQRDAEQQPLPVPAGVAGQAVVQSLKTAHAV